MRLTRSGNASSGGVSPGDRPPDDAILNHYKIFNHYEEQMGSTPFGDAAPATVTGQAAPQHIAIDRDSRVRVDA
jgi:hypothetical protein